MVARASAAQSKGKATASGAWEADLGLPRLRMKPSLSDQGPATVPRCTLSDKHRMLLVAPCVWGPVLPVTYATSSSPTARLGVGSAIHVPVLWMSRQAQGSKMSQKTGVPKPQSAAC